MSDIEPDTGTAPAPYSMRDHGAHMRALLSAKTIDTVVTVDELLGRAPFEETFLLLTRTFIQQNRSLCLRASDLDREVARRRRDEKTVARADAQRLTSSPADTATSLYMWEEECLKQWGCTVTGQGALMHPEFNAIGARNALMVLNSERGPGAQFKDSAIRAGFERVVANWRLARLDDIRADLACDKLVNITPDQVISLFADLMRLGLAHSCPFSAEEAAKIVCKTIWQVKRKLNGLPVSRHVMLVFVGPQGGGKSDMVRAFHSPIEELTCSVDLKTITDERVFGVFDNFLGIVDELDKADRANVESLKRIITEKTMDRRPMQSNSSVKVMQNLTFVGTSNRDVGEAIIDETGNRRFVSLQIIGAEDQPDKDNLFWDAVNAFAWLDLWRAVDPTGPDPTADMWRKIQTVQQSERSLSNTELWLEHNTGQTEAAIWAPWTSTADLYLAYRLWEDEFSPRSETSYGWWRKAFSRMAKQCVIPFVEHRKNGERGYDYVGAPGYPAVTPAPAQRAVNRRGTDL